MKNIVDHNQTDIAIIGGGIAGITAALEILEKDKGHNIVLLDAQSEQDFGGLAKNAFGGMMLVDTPLQRKSGIKDSVNLALRDWFSFAEFNDDDHWPKKWARYYVEQSTSQVYDWVTGLGLKYLPSVQWVERGLFQPGNSVARYHILYGTAQHLMNTLISRLSPFVESGQLTLLFNTVVETIFTNGQTATGLAGKNTKTDQAFTLDCGKTIIATGGIGGNIEMVKDHWSNENGRPPEKILNGCHPSSNGHLHTEVRKIGGQVTHLDKMWNYAAGIHHPKPKFEGHGLSLVPTKSSLWLNHQGHRIGPLPLVTGFDTHYLCQQVAAQEKPWCWHVMNWKIARRELAISGAEHNPDLRDRKFFKLVLKLLLANDGLVQQMISESDDFIVADNLSDLSKKMNALTGKDYIKAADMEKDISEYDQRLSEGPKFHNDDQIRRVDHLRAWPGDRLRTCKHQQILDPKAGPLIAIRTHLISRKTLGGIQTNLDCSVLNTHGTPIENLFAIGEAAGFGGGGASGKRSLEGTFLAGCILTARRVADVLSNS